ncbi:MAG TPA: PHP domain-containing protein [Clostridiales bacterium]|nr:PHP domain-containing protein [Clostridiales bacterium]
MYKYDVHVHTAEVSPCGQVKASDMVQFYSDKGYDGIVITDHYYLGYFESLGEIAWKDKINSYLSGYYEAKEAGYKHNVDVFLGMELRFKENLNDFLIYGIDEDFLLDNPELYKWNLEKFVQLKMKYDMLIYQAHPYRDNCSIVSPALLDGVEVYNCHPRHDSRNHLALEFAMNNELLMLSGSDAHMDVDVGRGGILSESRIKDSRHMVKVLRNLKEEDLIKSCDI